MRLSVPINRLRYNERNLPVGLSTVINTGMLNQSIRKGESSFFLLIKIEIEYLNIFSLFSTLIRIDPGQRHEILGNIHQFIR